MGLLWKPMPRVAVVMKPGVVVALNLVIPSDKPGNTGSCCKRAAQRIGELHSIPTTDVLPMEMKRVACRCGT